MDLRIVKVHDPNEWNDLLIHGVAGHYLQSWEWGQFKERHGWKAAYLSWRDSQNQAKALALILKRTLASRWSILYCPRGPVLDWSDEDLSSRILSELSAYTSSEKSIFIKLDPHLALGTGQPDSPLASPDKIGMRVAEQLQNLGWRPSAEQIQFRNTMILDLTPSEDDLLKGMKQKTRYNIRLADRKGVKVRKGEAEDLDLLYRMYAETAIRDHFAIREPDYYQDAWGSFFEARMAQPFIAEVDREPIAGIIVFRFGNVTTYMYGMSRDLHRDTMPNYLLQWEAMKWARSIGCKTYDFWGAPDHFVPDDPMWGVFRFKEGFGAKVIRTMGAWDYAVRPMFYQLYNVILPRILELMRIRGRSQTLRTLD